MPLAAAKILLFVQREISGIVKFSILYSAYIVFYRLFIDTLKI